MAAPWRCSVRQGPNRFGAPLVHEDHAVRACYTRADQVIE
jgi:hypothetical protein